MYGNVPSIPLIFPERPKFPEIGPNFTLLNQEPNPTQDTLHLQFRPNLYIFEWPLLQTLFSLYVLSEIRGFISSFSPVIIRSLMSLQYVLKPHPVFFTNLVSTNSPQSVGRLYLTGIIRRVPYNGPDSQLLWGEISTDSSGKRPVISRTLFGY